MASSSLTSSSPLSLDSTSKENEADDTVSVLDVTDLQEEEEHDEHVTELEEEDPLFLFEWDGPLAKKMQIANEPDLVATRRKKSDKVKEKKQGKKQSSASLPPAMPTATLQTEPEILSSSLGNKKVGIEFMEESVKTISASSVDRRQSLPPALDDTGGRIYRKSSTVVSGSYKANDILSTSPSNNPSMQRAPSASSSHGSYSISNSSSRQRLVSPGPSPKLAPTTPTQNGTPLQQPMRRQNMNHLIQFQLPPRMSNPFAPHRGTSSSNSNANANQYMSTAKLQERFLHANFRFVAREELLPGETALSVHVSDADTAVPWERIEQVIITTTEPPRCPICLNAPEPARLTKCGHVYCWPCLLQYIGMQEPPKDAANKKIPNWRKCPICYEMVYAKDLKCVVYEHVVDYARAMAASHAVNEEQRTIEVPMVLMQRAPLSTVALPVELWSQYAMHRPPRRDSEDPLERSAAHDPHTKLCTALRPYIRDHVYAPVKAQLLQRLTQKQQCGDEDVAAEAFIEAALNDLQLLLDKDASYPSPTSVTMSSYVPNAPISSSFSPQSNQEPEFFYFYQAADGQNLYLHPLDIKLLREIYGNYSRFPLRLTLKMQELAETSMNDDVRKRSRYMAHIPLSCDVAFCEVEWRQSTQVSIPTQVLQLFLPALKQRRDKRYDKAAREAREAQRRARDSSGAVMNSVPVEPMSSLIAFPPPSLDPPLTDLPPVATISAPIGAWAALSQSSSMQRQASQPGSFAAVLRDGHRGSPAVRAPDAEEEIATSASLDATPTRKGKKLLLLSTSSSRKY